MPKNLKSKFDMMRKPLGKNMSLKSRIIFAEKQEFWEKKCRKNETNSHFSKQTKTF